MPCLSASKISVVESLGHVGVGFQNDDGTWTIGGVEGDPDKTIQWGAIVPPIFGDNCGWVEEHKTLQEVAVIFHSLDYDDLKVIQVIEDNPNLCSPECLDFIYYGPQITFFINHLIQSPSYSGTFPICILPAALTRMRYLASVDTILYQVIHEI